MAAMRLVQQVAQRTHSLVTSPAGCALLAGIAAAALYYYSAAPGVEWQDSGTHQWRIVTGCREHPQGLALSHPLHYWLGRAILTVAPGEPAYLLNLLSGGCGALAVALLAGCVHRLVRHSGIALLAAATLGTAFIFWQMSSVTETYTLSAALLLLEWLCVITYAQRRSPAWLVAAFLANGLHVADHLLGLLTLLPLVLFTIGEWVRRRTRGAHLIWAAGLWIVGAAPYWLLCIQHFQRTGNGGETLRSAFFGGSFADPGFEAAVLNLHMGLSQWRMLWLNLGYNFPSVALPLAAWGIWKWRWPRRWRRLKWLFLTQSALLLLFVARYSIVDQPTFFVPVCVSASFWFALGVDTLRRQGVLRRRPFVRTLLQATPLLAIACYCVFPSLAENAGWWRDRLRHIPFRNEYRHFFVPWRFNDDSCVRFCAAAFEQVLPDDWILSDGTVAYPLAYCYATQSRSKAIPHPLRIYAWTRCLTDAGRPFPTPAELGTQVLTGHNVLIIPDGTLFYEDRLGNELQIRKGPEIWWIERP